MLAGAGLAADAAKERTETADRIMRILQEYGMLSGDEMSDYLLYTMKQIAQVTGTNTSDLLEGADKSMIGKASNKVMSKAQLAAKEKAKVQKVAKATKAEADAVAAVAGVGKAAAAVEAAKVAKKVAVEEAATAETMVSLA